MNPLRIMMRQAAFGVVSKDIDDFQAPLMPSDLSKDRGCHNGSIRDFLKNMRRKTEPYRLASTKAMMISESSATTKMENVAL